MKWLISISSKNTNVLPRRTQTSTLGAEKYPNMYNVIIYIITSHSFLVTGLSHSTHAPLGVLSYDCWCCVLMDDSPDGLSPSNFLQHLLHRHKFSYDTFVVSLALMLCLLIPQRRSLMCLLRVWIYFMKYVICKWSYIVTASSDVNQYVLYTYRPFACISQFLRVDSFNLNVTQLFLMWDEL